MSMERPKLYEEQTIPERVASTTSYLKSLLEMLIKQLKEENPGGIMGVVQNVTGARLQPNRNVRESMTSALAVIGEPLPRDAGQAKALLAKIDSPEIQGKILEAAEKGRK